MPEIQGGRWENLLRRIFSLKGPSGVATLMPELVPQVVVQPFDPEFRFPASERIASAVVIEGAAAGNNSIVRIRNPVGSGSIVIVEATWAAAPGGGSQHGAYISNFTTDLANGADGENARDTRAIRPIAPVTRQPVAVISSGVAAAISGVNIHRYRTNSVEPASWNSPVILSPGFGLDIGNETQNQEIQVSIDWRERAAEPGELIGTP